MESLDLLLAVLFGVALATGVAWFVFRARLRSEVETATAKSEASARVDSAELRQRLKGAEEELERSNTELRIAVAERQSLRDQLSCEQSEKGKFALTAERVPQLEQQVGRLSDQLQQADRRESDTRELNATLTVTANRTPRLEAELQKMVEELKVQGVEVQRLAAELAASRKELEHVKESATSSQDKSRTLTVELTEARHQLASLGAQSAKLEEQASGVPDLKLRLDGATESLNELKRQLLDARETKAQEVSRLTAELEGEKRAHEDARSTLTASDQRLRDLATELAAAKEENASLRERSDAEQRGASEKLELLLGAKEELSNQFKALSTEILEEKARRFAEQNNESLGQILSPLRAQLAEFKVKVEEVYVQEGKDRHALSEQVRLLADMNKMLSEDARKLTEALKGNAKAQGNWGELILERVLESAGLRKGHEFFVQESTRREDGSRGQPDVVINLPESRRLVVDAKVSLTAYEEYMRAESDDDRSLAGRRHLESVRGHIKGLSEKQYEALHGSQSPDFVIMFVPIDSAFMVASMQDGELFTHAWERNILLVSPSTLLFVVRIVAHLWRQEQQNQNAQEIADRGAKLYDQLTRFVEDLGETGKRIDQAQEAFHGAYKRLVKQKGNVVWQAEQLRKLGVKPTKVLPAAVLEWAEPDSDSAAVAPSGQGVGGPVTPDALEGS